jgi:C1A family cysteine protease
MRCVCAVALLGLVASDVSPRPDYRMMWTNFTEMYGKTYKNQVDEEQRFSAFCANVDFIYEENAKGNSYELGVNAYSDLTADEFWLSHGGYVKPDADEMWGSAANVSVHSYNGEALASSVDWTKKHVVTHVKKQHCSDCWAFSATGALESAFAISKKKHELPYLSEQQLVDCVSGSSCKGGNFNAAFQYAETHTMCHESSYKETGQDGQCKSSKCKKVTDHVSGYKIVEAGSETALMSAIHHTPVSVSIEADQNVFQHYKNGVLSMSSCGTKRDHAVLAIGYGSESGKNYWRIKNSWGTSWGNEGFVKLVRSKKGDGECGIMMSGNSYPIVHHQKEDGTVLV